MSRARPLLLLGLLAPLLAATPRPAGAGTAIGDPSYEWSFHRYPSDGAGGFTGAVLIREEAQVGGSVSDGVELSNGGDPEAEVFSSEGAADFWARATAPFVGDAAVGDPIGVRAELSVSQIFRKDSADATLSFTIPYSQLSAAHFFGPENAGLSGILVHSLVAGDFFAFFEEARLSGRGGAWTFSNGSGVLPYEITAGGLDQGSVLLEFTEAFVREIDLASVLLGEEFAVTYLLIAEALDSVQAKSGIEVFGFDPLDAADGASFEFSGLTPIGAPEPAGPLLLATGAALLGALGRRRAPSRQGRLQRSGTSRASATRSVITT